MAKIDDGFGTVMYMYIYEELHALIDKLSELDNVPATGAAVCTIIEQYAENCNHDIRDVIKAVKIGLKSYEEEE